MELRYSPGRVEEFGVWIYPKGYSAPQDHTEPVTWWPPWKVFERRVIFDFRLDEKNPLTYLVPSRPCFQFRQENGALVTLPAGTLARVCKRMLSDGGSIPTILSPIYDSLTYAAPVWNHDALFYEHGFYLLFPGSHVWVFTTMGFSDANRLLGIMCGAWGNANGVDRWAMDHAPEWFGKSTWDDRGDWKEMIGTVATQDDPWLGKFALQAIRDGEQSQGGGAKFTVDALERQATRYAVRKAIGRL